MIDIKTLNDTQKQRYAELSQNNTSGTAVANPIILSILIENVLPLLLMDDSVIENNVKITIDNAAISNLDNIPKLSDSEYLADTTKERFIFVCMCRSAISENNIMLFFDKKYSDIIVMPDIRSFNNADGVLVKDSVINIIANVIRNTTNDTGAKTLNMKLVNNSNSINGEIPETKENIPTTSLLTLLDGHDDDPKMRKAKLNQQYPTANLEIFRSELHPISFLRLGKASEIFSVPGDLPVNIVFQQTYEKYRYCNAGVIDTGERDLYIAVTF